MNKNVLILLIIVVSGLKAPVFAQSKIIDSIKLVLKSAGHDSIRFDNYLELGNYYSNISFDSAIYFHTQAQLAAKKINGPEGELRQAYAIFSMGWDNYKSSNLDSAKFCYDEALELAQKHIGSKNSNVFEKAKKLEASVLNNLGLIHAELSENDKALDCYFRALRINEEIANKRGSANNLSSIGSVYYSLEDNHKALDYYYKALKIKEEIQDKDGQGNSFSNIGGVYLSLTENENALKYFTKAQKVFEETGNLRGQAASYSNIGLIYEYLFDYEKALEFYQSALKINEETGKPKGQILNLNNIGILYNKLNQFSKAEKYFLKSEKLCRNLSNIYYLKEVCYGLSKVYENTNRPALALKLYREGVNLGDSINRIENQKAAIQKEMQFNFEKETFAESVANANQIEMKNVELAKQNVEIKAKKNQQYALFGGLGLVIIFAGFMFNRFKVTQKQKGIIELQKFEVERQKHLVEEKQKEVMDSIRYAQRIQRAQLPSEKKIINSLQRLMNFK